MCAYMAWKHGVPFMPFSDGLRLDRQVSAMRQIPSACEG